MSDAAHAAGEVVGYLLGYDQHRYAGMGGLKDAAWVEELMLAEDFRSRGIGSLLMQRFEDWARNRHCRLVAVGGGEDFYRAIGYERSGPYLTKNL